LQDLHTSLLNESPETASTDRLSLMESRLPAMMELASNCRLCPRKCGVDRTADELGTCVIPFGPVYSSANLHFGEEPPISGFRGSGTIFLTGCNLMCDFCQNFPISHLRHGNPTTTTELARQMLELQEYGAHNINLVTPTHQAAALYETLLIAFKRGLNIPVVYNCGGYESLEVLQLWDGIVDIYMPDAKYGRDEPASRLSNAPDYVHHNRMALKEMHRQVGVLQTDDRGVALSGLLIRHLVLPGDYSGSEEVFRFIADELSPDTYISLMSQYFPAWRALEHPVLSRKVSRDEYRRAMEALERCGLSNGWIQPF